MRCDKRKIHYIVLVILALILVFTNDGHANANSFYIVKININCIPNMLFSTYDVEVVFDNYKLATIPHGETYSESFLVEKGAHTLFFYEKGDITKETKGKINFDVTKNIELACAISCNSSRIVPKDITINSLKNTSENDVNDSLPKNTEAQLQAFYDDCINNGTSDNLPELARKHGLFFDCIKNNTGDEYYKIAHSRKLVKINSFTDLNTAGDYIVIQIDATENDSIKTIKIHREEDDHYDETLKGRGSSDNGREEPNYIGIIGYVAPFKEEAYQRIATAKDFQDEKNWTIPTYEPDKQFWNECGRLPHKTEVVVREQFLSHEGYGAYSGYLLVEKTDDGSQYYINVMNYITKPYWTYQNNLMEAALTGYYIAEYHQFSDYYPVTSGGNKVELKDGTIVLVTGITDLSRNIKSTQTNIEAVWGKGKGRSTYYFNDKDLRIIY